MDNKFTFEELLDMACAFARQVDDEQLFLSFVSTVFKAHTSEYGINITDYVGLFAKFIEFSESPFAKKLTEILHSATDADDTDYAEILNTMFDDEE